MKPYALFLIPLIPFAVLVYKIIRTERKTRLARQNANNWVGIARRNRLQWKRDHPHVSESHFEYQELLQKQVGALMFWLSAHEEWSEAQRALRIEELETLVSVLDPADKI